MSGEGKKAKRPAFKVYGVDYGGEREEYSLENRGKVRQLEVEIDLSLLIHSKGIHL